VGVALGNWLSIALCLVPPLFGFTLEGGRLEQSMLVAAVRLHHPDVGVTGEEDRLAMR
jgi:hypothetical protein